MPKRSLKRSTPVQHVHRFANMWALLTVLAFPAVMLWTLSAGVSSISAFFLGMLGSLAVLFVNVLIEGEVWMMDARWRQAFEHPHFAWRLAIISGALLLVVESTALVYFLTQPGLDETIAAVVLVRECVQPRGPVFAQLCQMLSSK